MCVSASPEGVCGEGEGVTAVVHVPHLDRHAGVFLACESSQHRRVIVIIIIIIIVMAWPQ